jgi:c-di-GMP-binding flagellar brake protein YcgR
MPVAEESFGHGATAPSEGGTAPERTPAHDARPACSFRDMRLKVGDRAQLEPPPRAGSERVPVRVVGWIENESLIVTVPQSPRGRLTLLEGEDVMLRVFTGQSAFAFRCAVLKRNSQAFDFLQLTFPDHVEGVAVRNSPRVRIGLPAKVTGASGGTPMDARIDNLGATGALLDSFAPLGARGDSLKVDFDMVLHEVPVSLSLSATIRSAQTDEPSEGAPRHRCGVSFVELTPNDRLILASLVWFHMYENPKLAV